ncbi:hypothetical protein TIFTF001_055450 [Ficus carica]|uniref:Uncharacterized protein n=1 Tax=Ficus carica TaxID=3494 RepID=A0AA88JFK9_FICCA|nr:hypothetical protein TIFTF001_055450 [Ficus carica]
MEYLFHLVPLHTVSYFFILLPIVSYPYDDNNTVRHGSLNNINCSL